MTGQSSSGHANGLGCNSKVVEKSPMFAPIPDSLYYFSPVVFQIWIPIYLDVRTLKLESPGRKHHL